MPSRECGNEPEGDSLTGSHQLDGLEGSFHFSFPAYRTSKFSHGPNFGADLLTEANVPFDPISFNASISACEKSSTWQQALALFLAMPRARVQADEISYNSAISACEKVGQWQLALMLFGAMPAARLLGGSQPST